MNNFIYHQLGIEFSLTKTSKRIRFFEWRNEYWKVYNDKTYPYIISSYGRIRSIPRQVSTRFRTYFTESVIMSTFLTRGYKRTAIRNISSKQNKFSIHRLVADTFLPPKPITATYIINHKDSNKINNHYSNLEWVTHQENATHYLCVNKSAKKTSKYIGVAYIKSKCIWQVKIKTKTGMKYKNFIDEDIAGQYYLEQVRLSGIQNRYLIRNK